MSTKRKRKLLLVIVAGLYLLVFRVGLERRQTMEQRAVDGNHAISVSRIAGVYAYNHEGVWPPLDPARRFAYAPSAVSLAYEIAKPSENNDEFVPVEAIIDGRLGRHNSLNLTRVWKPGEYYYLGYATTCEQEGLALAAVVHGDVALTENIPVRQKEGTLGTAKLYGLHNDLLKTLVDDGVLTEEDPAVRHRIPILIQRPVNGHAWVVYLDFQTEYLPYPGPYPLTENFIQALD